MREAPFLSPSLRGRHIGARHISDAKDTRQRLPGPFRATAARMSPLLDLHPSYFRFFDFP